MAKPPTTTTQQDITLASQRKVNLIWEYTQAVIAIGVVLGNLLVGAYTVFWQSKTAIPEIFGNAFFLVIGFYFSRTNHAAIGGIGAKANDSQTYLGR